jgi:hypothetical protein
MSIMCGIEPYPAMTQPRWGWMFRGLLTQGSSFVATLGWVTQSRWDRGTRSLGCITRRNTPRRTFHSNSVFTPTGSRPKAQGCPARATLGTDSDSFSNPNGVVSIIATATIQPHLST